MAPGTGEARHLDPVLLCALALAAGAPLALEPLPCAAALALVGATVWRSMHKWAIAALAIAAIGGLRSSAALDDAQVAHERVSAGLSGLTDCVVMVRVVRSPVVLRRARSRDPPGGRAEEQGTDARVDVEVVAAHCHRGRLNAGTRLRLYAAPEDLARGDVLFTQAAVAPIQLFWNPGVRDARVSIALDGVTASGTATASLVLGRAWATTAFIDRLRCFVRRRIETTFTSRAAPLARALMLGESDLVADERAAFRDSGLAHLLAVSGTHLVLAVLTLVRALEMLLRRVETLARRVEPVRVAAAMSVPLAWLYADFAGGGGSAYRAAAMLSLAMIARACGRRPCPVRCFALSLALGAVAEPLVICEPSFALSVAATGGLLASRAPIAALMRGSPAPMRPVGSPMLATLAASLACAPLLLALAPTLPLVGVAANVLAAPVGELAALPLCLAHAALWWAPAAERGAAVLAGAALEIVSAIAHAAAASPAGGLSLPPPTPWQLAVLAVAAVALAMRRARARWIAMLVLSLSALELAARADALASGRLRLTVLDVAQGDALLVDLPDGSLMLVDGGGLVGSRVDVAQRVILPVLRARRRGRIDVVVLSHPHPDHYLGLLGALPKLEVGELWWTGLEMDHPRGELARLGARLERAGTRVLDAEALCRDDRELGGARVRVLAPCPGPDPDLGANDNSLVLWIGFGQRSILLMGDAEREAEHRLLAAHRDDIVADLIKVGHHGSRTSTGSALLTKARPSLAVISCGARNRFGHPHPEPLEALARAGVPALRTDRGGAVVWETDGTSSRWWQMGVSTSSGAAQHPTAAAGLPP